MARYANFEEILSTVVNPFGQYQIRFAILLQLCVLGFCGNFIVMSYGMLEPIWRCETAEYSNVEHFYGEKQSAIVHIENGSSINVTGKCNIRSSCPAANLTLESKAGFYSVVEHWELYCEHDYIPHMITTMQMVGGLLGFQITGHIADHFGRRIVFLGFVSCCIVYKLILANFKTKVSMILTCLISLVSIFSTGWIFFTVCRFLVGFVLSAAQQSVCIWSMEITDSDHNILMSCASLWQFCYMVVALIGYLSGSWKMYVVIINIIMIPSTIALAFYKESPRWLIQHERYEEAHISIMQMASINNKVELMSTVTVEDLKDLKVNNKARGSFIDLFSNKTIILHTFLMVGSLFVASTVATSFVFNLKNLAGNPFMDIFIYGCARSWIPFFAYYMDKRFSWFGRRPLFLCSIASVMTCFLAVTICFAIDNPSLTAVTVFTMLGAVLTNFLWIVLGVYQVELFPTIVRVIASGFVCIGSEIGGIIAPQLLYLDKIMPSLPYIFLLVICVLSFVFGFWLLPETKGLALPEDLLGDEPVKANEMESKKKNTNE